MITSYFYECAKQLGQLTLVGAVVALAGCGGGGGTGSTSNNQPPPTQTGLQATITKSATVSVNLPLINGAADPLGGNAAGTAVLDFDGDGLRDLLITPSYLKSQPELPVILLRQTAAGFMDARTAFGGSVPTPGVARTPQVADFNLDGKDDYFTSDTGLEILSNGQFIKSNNRLFLSGTGAAQMSSQTLPTLAFNHGSCAADIDGDGRTDVVVTPLSAPKTYILLNTSVGWQQDQTRLPTELTQFSATNDFNPSSCALADMNRDGKVDLIASGYNDGLAAGSTAAPYATGTRILLNNGSGTFLGSTSTLVRPAGADWGSTSIRVADFDADGRPDLLIAYELQDSRFALQLWLQKSAGALTDSTVGWLGTYETSIGFWREMDVGDFNGDGKPDIYLRSVGTFSGTGTAEVLRRSILLNSGNGFTNPGQVTLSAATTPTFMLPLRTSGKTLTLVGYESVYGTNGYSGITPVTISIAF
jgi:hypothetical protein